MLDPAIEQPEGVERLWTLFHELWGRDSKNQAYSKDRWMELQRLLLEFIPPIVRAPGTGADWFETSD